MYAPTIPGFGRSEKPALGYSQTLWSDFLRDFVVELIRRPVVVVGNSIGGYICASLAATNPALVKGAQAACFHTIASGSCMHRLMAASSTTLLAPTHIPRSKEYARSVNAAARMTDLP